MKENITNHSLGAIICAGTLLLTGVGASAQNLYAATYGAGNVIQITPGGVQTTFASNLNYPFGLAFNSAGDLFVGDSANNATPGGVPAGNIVEIASNGTQSTFATGVDPQGLAFNSAGDLFEADYRSGNIYEFTPAGIKSTFATGFSFPLALAFDSAGNLYVGAGAGNGNGYITEITPEGTPTTFATGLSFPTGLAIDSAGDLFVGNNSTGAIYEYGPGGRSTIATLPGVGGLAFDNSGDLFVAASGGPNSINIDEITPGGTPTSFATLTGTSAQLAFPVPEPGIPALAGLGGLASLIVLRTNRKA